MTGKRLFLLIIPILILIVYIFQSSQTPKTISKTTIIKTPSKTPETFPLSNYSDRLKIRKYGQYFGSGEKPSMKCGREFVGFHTGDDLEIFENEENIDVPVRAVVSGKILSASKVNGYGGLLIQSAVLSGEPATIYYGHIDLGSVSKKVGDEISKGEQIAILGEGCSTETDGERKHLHFAIKKGTDVDLRGYVHTANLLSSWENPGELLKKLSPL